MRAVDDLSAELDRILGGIPRRRRVAGERIDDADLDVVRGAGRKRDSAHKQGGSENMIPHAFLPGIFHATTDRRRRLAQNASAPPVARQPWIGRAKTNLGEAIRPFTRPSGAVVTPAA